MRTARNGLKRSCCRTVSNENRITMICTKNHGNPFNLLIKVNFSGPLASLVIHIYPLNYPQHQNADHYGASPVAYKRQGHSR